MKKILIILAFTVNIGLTVFGFATLLDSPYTGIRMTVCGDHACIKSVDKGSPADGKIIEGDRLISIEDMVIPHLAFNEDPNYIRSRKDHLIFWEAQRRLSESVIKDKSATFLLERERSLFAVSLTPGSFPLISVLARIIPLYLVGWTFVGVAYLVLKKKHHEIAVVNFLISIFASMSFLSFAPYQFRDLYFSAPAFKLLSAANDIGSQAFSCAALHMVLIFPRRKKVVIVNPWILRLPYVYLLVIFVAHVSAVFDNVQLTTYGVMNVCLLSCFARFLYDYSVEENMLYKKQIQWVIFGMVAGITFWLTMTSIPIMLGLPFISKEISVLPTVIHPLFFAVAVMKYRLMDIESIFDVAVVYGFTIAILAGVETAFLSFASPYLLTAGKGLPAFSVVAVLLIVFIYVPIRNTVKSLVERLFKRGKYDPEKELQQFMVRLGLCDERSALEKFTAFVKGLLRPSGVFVMKIEDKSVLLLHVDNEHARQVGEKSVPNAGEVWGHVRSKGTCTFGYELSEKIGQDSFPFTPDLENALFVPFITDQDNMASGYLAVLLKKWNETAYSIKDVTLLNAISVNIANIIEAGELRRERAGIEERYRKEKDAVMKELHDGLGNILTGITVTTQAAERLLDQGPDKAREQVGRIGEFSLEAMDFLRTGLTVLDNPHGELGAIMEGMRDRYGDMFESAGMELKIELSDDAGRLRPGAVTALNVTRVIQEALSNVMRHAGARSVTIRMGIKGDGLTVTISDDGNGFSAGRSRAGRGLANMRRRVEDIGGSFTVESMLGKGTEIGFTVPSAGKQGERTEYALGDR